MRWKASSKFHLTLLLVLSMVTIFPIESEAVTPSKEEYTVSFQDTYDVFVGCKTPVAFSKGKEVYLVYTVESVDEAATTSYQHGIVASDTNSERYPYEDGGLLQYSNTSGLLEEGSTYFLKFYMTESGMECVAVRANGDDREVINLPEKYGDATDNFRYVGIWFGCGNVTAEFSHVLCYDETGKDLGVCSTTATVPPSKAFQYDTNLQQAYDVTSTKAFNVGLHNEKKTDSNVIYFEYTVESSESMLYQTGVFATKKTEQQYPHDDGILLHDSFTDNLGNGFLLEPGASYIVKISKEKESLEAQVQKTIDGEYEIYSFPNPYGTYEQDAPYVGLWFGEGVNYKVTFHLVNMKCYDGDGNNLGISCNQGTVGIVQKGEKADYSEVGGVYYNAKEDTMIELFADQIAKVTKEGVMQDIAYEIWESTIHFDYADGRESYRYSPQRIYSENVAYDRLNTYYIDFVTGTDQVIEMQRVDRSTDFVAIEPKEPSKEGATFEGWVLSDGTEYEFGSVVSKSMTLYAKWSDEVEYHKLETGSKTDWAPFIAIASSVVILLVAIGISILIVRRGGKKHDKN